MVSRIHALSKANMGLPLWRSAGRGAMGPTPPIQKLLTVDFSCIHGQVGTVLPSGKKGCDVWLTFARQWAIAEFSESQG